MDTGKILNRVVEGAEKVAGKMGGSTHTIGTTAGILAGRAAYKSGAMGAYDVLKGKSFLRTMQDTSAHSAVLIGAVKAASGVIEENPNATNVINQFRLSGMGKAMVLGALGASAVKNAVETNNTMNLGVVAPNATPAPQAMYDYDEITNSGDANASGDLVFALNKLRHG